MILIVNFTCLSDLLPKFLLQLQGLDCLYVYKTKIIMKTKKSSKGVVHVHY